MVILKVDLVGFDEELFGRRGECGDLAAEAVVVEHLSALPDSSIEGTAGATGECANNLKEAENMECGSRGERWEPGKAQTKSRRGCRNRRFCRSSLRCSRAWSSCTKT